MVSVILIFIYILFTASILGAALIEALVKKQSYIHLHLEDACVLGLMVATVYAQVFSLFFKVGMLANIILLVICALLLIILIKKRTFVGLFNETAKKSILVPIGVLVVLIMVYGTSAGYFHYDSDLYHGQAIRWIEEYGVVKGLGNLHTRLAFNSSSFALGALYSFSWISGRSYHACAGFLALIVLVDCLRVVPSMVDKNIKIADFVRVGGIYYILNIYDEMVSPESDYFAVLLLFFIVIRMVDLAEEKVKDSDAYAIFALLSIFLITVKLSVAALIVISIVPIVFLVNEKRFFRIGMYVAIGFGIVLPFLIRGVLISGYILYPSTLLNIFNVDWKIPKYVAKAESDYLIAYGRGYDYLEAVEKPFKVWFPHWVESLDKMGMILVLASVAGILFFFASFLLRKKQNALHYIEASVIAVFISWFLSAPLIRYAQGTVICLLTLMAGDAFSLFKEGMKEKKLLKNFFVATCITLFSLFLVYKAGMLAKYIVSAKNWNGYLINQQDYTTYSVATYEIDGVNIYAPREDDRVGYNPFPATPQINVNVGLRGTDISDGFVYRY